MSIYSKLKLITPDFVRFLIFRLRDFVKWNPHRIVMYSQGAEDIILASIFGNREKGFWVDVGAHHPQRFSNTYLFSLKGWTGINIDALPGSMAIFKKMRPNDINLEIPIFNERKKLTYFQFNEPALNGFSEELSLERNGIGGAEIIKRVEMEGFPLKDILAEHLPKDQNTIDFLSVDVEGYDLPVLESNNWNTYRPKVVLVELLNRSMEKLKSDPVVLFLEKKNYQLFAKACQTAFFVSNEYMAELDVR